MIELSGLVFIKVGMENGVLTEEFESIHHERKGQTKYGTCIRPSQSSSYGAIPDSHDNENDGDHPGYSCH